MAAPLMSSRHKAWQTQNGFIIEALPALGKWRMRVTKADRPMVRTALRGEPDEVAPEWLSGPYMARDVAIEQVKRRSIGARWADRARGAN